MKQRQNEEKGTEKQFKLFPEIAWYHLFAAPHSSSCFPFYSAFLNSQSSRIPLNPPWTPLTFLLLHTPLPRPQFHFNPNLYLVHTCTPKNECGWDQHLTVLTSKPWPQTLILLTETTVSYFIFLQTSIHLAPSSLSAEVISLKTVSIEWKRTSTWSLLLQLRLQCDDNTMEI